ncbi:MAG: enoyl-CoA hydratase [Betaproteobacteria bacterium]
MAELITKTENGVGWIIFSNLTKLNAVTYDMWVDLPVVLARYDADPAVRVVVITGDGEKAFIAGADISEFEKKRSDADSTAVYNRATEAAYLAPKACRKPVIAKIRGICVGGGLGLAAACDLRFASDDAVFRMPAARLGLGYGYAGFKLFVDIMGQSNTADIFYSARKFGAADALRMGLVSRAVPAADLDREVAEYCKMVVENAPLTVATAKFALAQTIEDPDKRDISAVGKNVAMCFASDDYKEGRVAFMQKRTPSFQGK